MQVRETVTHEDYNGKNLIHVKVRQKGYGFGARWQHSALMTHYLVDGKKFANKREAKAYVDAQAPKHATVTILGVGEATKPALNPVVEAEMRELGLIK